MSRLTLDLAHAALAAAIAFESTKARIPGDHDDPHEDNTFGLPNGDPIRRRLKGFFNQQLKQVVGQVATIGHPLDTPLPRLADYNTPMADIMTPIVGVYWDRAGKGLRERIGLDPEDWRVTDPHIHAAIKEQCLKFCAKTNATTSLGIAEARDKVRDQLARGLIGQGQTIPELTSRIRTVFTGASKNRAETIARTEAARAVHAASEMSARQSGLITTKRWLLSANSCPICVNLAARVPTAPLDGSFATIGKDPDYSDIKFPPAHPRCRCSIAYELIEEPPDHREKDKENEETHRQLEREPGEPGLKPLRPSRNPHAGGLARTVRTGRQVAAFVGTSYGAAQVGRAAVPTIRQAIARHRERQARTSSPPSTAPKPAQIPAVTPGAPIAQQIAAYIAGPGAAKLAALAALGETHLELKGKAQLLKLGVEAEEAVFDQIRNPTPEQKAAINARIDEYNAAFHAYEAQVDRNADDVADILQVPASEAELIRSRMVTKSRPLPEINRRSEEWLGRVLKKEPSVRGGLAVQYGFLHKNGRANYRHQYKRIDLTGDEQRAVIVHELMHGVEHQFPNIGALSAEFLDYRVGSEKIQKLRDALPGTHKEFETYEVGRKDRFDEAFTQREAFYVGKEYRGKLSDKDSRWATEILSMGVQKLMEDPTTFAKKDPEFCAFVLGVLDGNIRTPAAAIAKPKPGGRISGLFDRILPSTRRARAQALPEDIAADPHSVAAHIKLADDSVKPHFEEALAAINMVHTDGKLPDIPAMANPRLKTTEGGFIHDKVKGIRIELNPEASHPAFVAIHEIGHFIDLDGPVQSHKVLSAINESKTSAQLAKELAKTRDPALRKHLNYLNRDDEKLARAYSQYIATRCKNPKILAGFEKDKLTRYGKIMYWDDKSFGPIADQFDAMFEKAGWLHGRGT